MTALTTRVGFIEVRERDPGVWEVSTRRYGSADPEASCFVTGPSARQAAHAWARVLHQRAFPDREMDLWRVRLRRMGEAPDEA